MSNYKLIASDMDGTLLKSDGTISKETADIVNTIQDKGFIFTISTGRSEQGVTKFKDIINLNGLAILYNGAMIADLKNNKTLYVKNLLLEDSRKIIKLGQDYDTTMYIWSDNKLYCNKENEKLNYYKNLSNVEAIVVDNINDILNLEVTKIIWDDEEEKTNNLLKELSNIHFINVNYCTSRSTYIEFFNKDVSKAKALAKICDIYKLNKDEIIAIGDGLNDLEMIQYAGLGIAMKNANEKLKENANYITDTNDENGVEKAIKKFLLSQK